MVTGSMFERAITTNRLGLGTRLDDALTPSPRKWLADGMSAFRARPPALAPCETSAEISARYLRARNAFRKLKASGQADDDAANPANELARRIYLDHAKARVAAGIDASAPFVERMVHFWANHFAVSADKPSLRALAGTLEFEAIRPHVLGRFSDMLLAVERHPAMLAYLDQTRSVGPNSSHAARQRVRHPAKASGLNENLAREILELHTLGVDGGYGQSDVENMAHALTGWTVGGFNRDVQAPPGQFTYEPEMHEPGDRRLLGERYVNRGEGQAKQMLMRLALHASTARHIAGKLARHFAADIASPSLVDRLASAFLASGGDLPSVYSTLVASAEVWTSPLVKFKSPWDWLISAVRGLGLRPEQVGALEILNDLGQPVWRPKSPAGWGDTTADWAGPDALVHRLAAADKLARLAAPLDPRALGNKLLPGVLRPSTATMISRTGSPVRGLALLLLSPEFLRR